MINARKVRRARSCASRYQPNLLIISIGVEEANGTTSTSCSLFFRIASFSQFLLLGLFNVKRAMWVSEEVGRATNLQLLTAFCTQLVSREQDQWSGAE